MLWSDGWRRKGWAFEGWTSVDCWLETRRALVFVEGKRSEPVASATDWFPARNQLARNVEVATEVAMRRGKDFVVVLCSEELLTVTRTGFHASFPHLTIGERDDLFSHYLGCITWRQVRDVLCPEVEFPANVGEAVEFCANFR